MIAASNLVKGGKKSFVLADIIAAEKKTYKNLIEMIHEYPSKGVGFKIWKRHWPEHSYIKITHSEFDSNRRGRVYGRQYVKGVPQTDKYIEVDQVSTRGLWRYDLGDSIAYLDNGLIYTLADMIDHYETIKQIEWIRPEDLRKNMDWSPPEGAEEPLTNINVKGYKGRKRK